MTIPNDRARSRGMMRGGSRANVMHLCRQFWLSEEVRLQQEIAHLRKQLAKREEGRGERPGNDTGTAGVA